MVTKRKLTTFGIVISWDLLKSAAIVLRNIFSGRERNASAVRFNKAAYFPPSGSICRVKSEALAFWLKLGISQFEVSVGKAARISEIISLTSGEAA